MVSKFVTKLILFDTKVVFRNKKSVKLFTMKAKPKSYF